MEAELLLEGDVAPFASGDLATLAAFMDAAHTIRDAVTRVAAIRFEAASIPGLQNATTAVKSFQGKRFAGTYSDLLATTEYSRAARFFLDELYSDKDYSQRDSQFARIAGGLQTFFPVPVVATAVSLAELHVLTEEFDRQMALVWMKMDASKSGDEARQYMAAWAQVGRAKDRTRQLDTVLAVGHELDRLTRTPGLRFMLRMMRRPAVAAGLGSLQAFLESGFDTFAQMAGKGERAHAFLEIIRTRESAWFDRLFSQDMSSCEAELRDCLSRAI